MDSILLAFCYISCFLSLLCFFIIYRKNKFPLYSKILILSSIAFCFFVIGAWTLYQGKIPLLPYAYISTLVAPLYFLPGLILFLYIKSVLNKNKKFSAWNLLHFIPAILNLISLIPYILIPVANKQSILLSSILNPEKPLEVSVFFMSMNFDIFSKILLWLIYIVLTIRALIIFNKKNKYWISVHKEIWTWIIKITAINALSLFLYIFILATGYDAQSFSKALVIPPIFFIISSIIVLMFNPKILYGIKSLSNDENQTEEVLSKTLDLSPQKIEEYKAKINQYIVEKQIFLVKNYSIKDMAVDFDIPHHHLSYVINNEFGTNYKNYINKLRVDYIIQNRYREDWAQFTLEGIGNEAGFNSRNTFFKAFKQATGQSPAEYFKKIKG